MARQEMIYDDDYTGPRWCYGLTYRPAAFANIPDGRIIFGDRPHEDYRHGTVQYPRALSQREVEAFQLTPVEAN